MNNEKRLTPQILAMYLSARCRHRYVDYDGTTWTIWSELTPSYLNKLTSDASINGIQLRLRRLEDMSEEEARQMFTELFPGQDISNSSFKEEGVNRFRDFYTGVRLTLYEPVNITDFSSQFQYLLSKSFDLFGLIDSGNAIDAKTL